MQIDSLVYIHASESLDSRYEFEATIPLALRLPSRLVHDGDCNDAIKLRRALMWQNNNVIHCHTISCEVSLTIIVAECCTITKYVQ